MSMNEESTADYTIKPKQHVNQTILLRHNLYIIIPIELMSPRMTEGTVV